MKTKDPKTKTLLKLFWNHLKKVQTWFLTEAEQEQQALQFLLILASWGSSFCTIPPPKKSTKWRPFKIIEETRSFRTTSPHSLNKTKTLAKFFKSHNILLLLVCTSVRNNVLRVLNHFQWFWSNFTTISKGLYFVLLGPLYKNKTLAKIDKKKKTANLVAPCYASVKNHVWAFFKWIDLKTILKGSSFLGLRYLVFAF